MFWFFVSCLSQASVYDFIFLCDIPVCKIKDFHVLDSMVLFGRRESIHVLCYLLRHQKQCARNKLAIDVQERQGFKECKGSSGEQISASFA